VGKEVRGAEKGVTDEESLAHTSYDPPATLRLETVREEIKKRAAGPREFAGKKPA